MRPAQMKVFGPLALTVVALVATGPRSAQGETPLDVYKAYLYVASKATTPDALFPYISKEYMTLLQNAPRAEVDKMIKMSIAKDKLTDIAVKSQQAGASKAVRSSPRRRATAGRRRAR
jgi:hypothetical protein